MRTKTKTEIETPKSPEGIRARIEAIAAEIAQLEKNTFRPPGSKEDFLKPEFREPIKKLWAEKAELRKRLARLTKAAQPCQEPGKR